MRPLGRWVEREIDGACSPLLHIALRVVFPIELLFTLELNLLFVRKFNTASISDLILTIYLSGYLFQQLSNE